MLLSVKAEEEFLVVVEYQVGKLNFQVMYFVGRTFCGLFMLVFNFICIDFRNDLLCRITSGPLAGLIGR